MHTLLATNDINNVLQTAAFTIYLSLEQYKTIQSNISHIRCQNIKKNTKKLYH